MIDDYDHIDGRKKTSKSKNKSKNKKKKISYSKALQSKNPFKWYKGKSKESGTRVMIIPPSMYKKLGIKKVSKKEYLSMLNKKSGKKVKKTAGKKSGKKVKKTAGSKSRSKSGNKVKKTAGKKSGKKSGKKVKFRSKAAMLKIKRNEKKITAMFKLGKHPKRPKSCVRQYSKKYTSRKSPPYPANECCGHYVLGNDDKSWVSKMASNGVCRWVRDYTPLLY